MSGNDEYIRPDLFLDHGLGYDDEEEADIFGMMDDFWRDEDMFYFLHLFTFQTPIFTAKKIQKGIKSIVGISPTMVLLFPLPFYWKW